MQKLGFAFELHTFLILKIFLLSFTNHTFLFWHGSLITQRVKAILLITQKTHFPFFRMPLIKTVLLI